MSPGIAAQELKTVAARVDSSDKECRMRDTVKRPREKARSTSHEVAKATYQQALRLEYSR